MDFQLLFSSEAMANCATPRLVPLWFVFLCRFMVTITAVTEGTPIL